MKILKFGAKWCMPCKMMEPGLVALAGSGIPVHEVDIDEVSKDVLDDWGIAGVPVTILMTDSFEQVDRVAGPISPGNLRKLVN